MAATVDPVQAGTQRSCSRKRSDDRRFDLVRLSCRASGLLRQDITLRMTDLHAAAKACLDCADIRRKSCA